MSKNKPTEAEQKVIDDAAEQKVIDDAAEQKVIDDAAEQKVIDDAAEAVEGPVIAPGKSVTSLRGTITEGEPCSAKDFSNGEEDFNHLVEAGVIVDK